MMSGFNNSSETPRRDDNGLLQIVRKWPKTLHPKGLALCFAMAAAPLHAPAQEAPAPVPPTAVQSAPQAAPAADEVVTATPAEIAYATQLHLAYVTSASARVNDTAQSGLSALADTLTRRTNIHPAGVVGLDIERDDLSLFPFIYWPISADDTPISPQARDKVQRYLNNGGMILFDIRGNTAEIGNVQAIADVVGPLSISPLEQLDEEHTLTRSFYLLSTLRGSFNYQRIWVEQDGPEGVESVSNVIIGENDWAAAWAARSVPEGSRPHELSLRAGINMLMYVLTGDYKSDQLHLDQTLDNLGPRP